MAESHIFHLERLYFGSLVRQAGGVPVTPGVIASTPNLTPQDATECLQAAPLMPPRPAEAAPEMPGALGLFRGRKSDFILAKAQLNDAGQPQILYLRVPLAALRLLKGNVLALQPLGMMEMPSFTAIKPQLSAYELRIPPLPGSQAQSDALLALLVACGDSFKVVEGVLAGLVQGMPIAVLNAPASLERRLTFVQGLLNLLPIPARIGITFATYLADPQRSAVQIKFLGQGVAAPERHLVFDWGAGELRTIPPDDPYSRYILTQFKLDPSLVCEETTRLTQTTVWRASQADNLASMLSWVARRAAVDRTVSEGLPADHETVAAILREDPTLTDDLRQTYTRHLLAFVLALSDPAAADVIPAIALDNEATARTVTHHLQGVIQGGQAHAVYQLVERWLVRVPETARLRWPNLLHEAARQHLSDLLKTQQFQAAIDFITQVKQVSTSASTESTLFELIELARPAAQDHAGLAQAVFLMAAEALPAGLFNGLLGDVRLVRQLPGDTQAAIAWLQPTTPAGTPAPRLLDRGARAFGDQYQPLILLRFVETAMYLQRTALLDTAALKALLALAQSSRATDYETLIHQVVEELSQLATIRTLEPPGPSILIQLLLHINQFDYAVALLEFYQTTVFGPEQLGTFTKLAGDVFRMVRLAPERLSEAAACLEGSQIRPEPRAVILANCLANRQWADDQDYAASRLTTMLFKDHQLTGAVGDEYTLKLLGFHVRRHDTASALHVGAAIVEHAVSRGKPGAELVTQMWHALAWDMSVAESAYELLRHYLRRIPIEQVPDTLAVFGGSLSEQLVEPLWATYLLRCVVGDNGIQQFAEDVHLAVQMLTDLACTYYNTKDLPPTHRLRQELDTLTGGLSAEDRQQIARNIAQIMHLVYKLGQGRTRRIDRQPVEERLIRTALAPRCGVDLLRFIGGHFADGRIIALNLHRSSIPHVFGTRSAAMILRETNQIVPFLSDLHTAFDAEHTRQVTSQALVEELVSLWNGVSLYDKQFLREQVAQDCQHLADVVSIIADNANDRVFADSGQGRQLETGQRQPTTAIEALRWINGYFAQKHARPRS